MENFCLKIAITRQIKLSRAWALLIKNYKYCYVTIRYVWVIVKHFKLPSACVDNGNETITDKNLTDEALVKAMIKLFPCHNIWSICYATINKNGSTSMKVTDDRPHSQNHAKSSTYMRREKLLCHKMARKQKTVYGGRSY